MSEVLTDRTLEVLELETGAMGCISPERHQRRWLQKVQYLEGKIAAAQSLEEKVDLEQQLENINRLESKKAELIADIYNLNSQIETI
jgi:hypothetical protein